MEDDEELLWLWTNQLMDILANFPLRRPNSTASTLITLFNMKYCGRFSQHSHKTRRNLQQVHPGERRGQNRLPHFTSKRQRLAAIRSAMSQYPEWQVL